MTRTRVTVQNGEMTKHNRNMWQSGGECFLFWGPFVIPQWKEVDMSWGSRPNWKSPLENECIDINTTPYVWTVHNCLVIICQISHCILYNVLIISIIAYSSMRDIWETSVVLALPQSLRLVWGLIHYTQLGQALRSLPAGAEIMCNSTEWPP